MRQGCNILRSILRSPLFLGNCHFGLQHKRPTQGTGCETKCCLSMTNFFLCLGVVVCGTCHEGLRLKFHVNFQRMTSSPWSQNMVPDGHWFAGQEHKLRPSQIRSPPLHSPSPACCAPWSQCSSCCRLRHVRADWARRLRLTPAAQGAPQPTSPWSLVSFGLAKDTQRVHVGKITL